MAKQLNNSFLEEQIELIHLSWKTVSRVKNRVGMMSFEKMFYRSPRLRKMFSGDLNGSVKRLMVMLEATVHNLDEWENVEYIIQSLAEDYHGYGLQAKDFKKWERSVLWGLYKAMGNDWNDILRQSWEELLGRIRKQMISHIKTLK